ncbi:hypothetical protein MJ565_04735 [Klebsiella pneumoniae]|nr:hypothetical protein MJ565_04735 [Klebsiella pneumoniae]
MRTLPQPARQQAGNSPQLGLYFLNKKKRKEAVRGKCGGLLQRDKKRENGKYSAKELLITGIDPFFTNTTNSSRKVNRIKFCFI